MSDENILSYEAPQIQMMKFVSVSHIRDFACF